MDDERARFERAILPHLDAAYNLARWLTRNDHDAEDVLQEACLRAQQFFGGLQGADGRAWLLTVVRNACYTWLERNRPRTRVVAIDEHKHSSADSGARPPSLAMRGEDRQLLRQALEQLSPEYREVIVLRELEGFTPCGPRRRVEFVSRWSAQRPHRPVHRTSRGSAEQP